MGTRYKVGMYGGAFDPPHLGHLTNMAKAAALCEELYVVICWSEGRESTSKELRYRWILNSLKHLDNVKILFLEDDAATKAEYDADDYWQKGARAIKTAIGKMIDAVFCGSDYRGTGRFESLYAPEADVVYFDRAAVPISSTEIRANPSRYWDYIPAVCRDYYAKKVLIVGSQSVGKTVLTQNLALAYNTTFVAEVGRATCDYAGGEELMIADNLYENLLRQRVNATDAAKTCGRRCKTRKLAKLEGARTMKKTNGNAVKRNGNSLTRRQFVESGAAALGVWAVVPYFAGERAKTVAEQAPSDRLRVAAVGVGPMGYGDLCEFNGLADVVAICDLDEKYGLARVLANPKIGKKTGDKVAPPTTYSDYRRVLDRDDVDVVAIATPDHWHVKIAIEAMQAGKHVFCQKPLTLTLAENVLIREAQKKYGKVFQVGTQQRAQRDQFLTAAALIRKGLLGEIKRTTCIIDQGRYSGQIPKCDPPATLDWERWQGQAPVFDYCWENREEFYSPGNVGQGRGHLLFRWWFEYSGGKITDWGAHHIDAALWALGRQEIGSGPVSVDGTDAKFIVDYDENGFPKRTDVYNTPITFNVRCKFADGTDFDVVSDAKDGNGILFEGTKGRIHVNRARIAGKIIDEGVRSELTDEDFVALFNGKPVEGHKSNFLRCVREGGTPVSNVAENVLGMHVCHLANISCRLKRAIRWDSQNEKIVGDDVAASFFSREQRKGYELPNLT